MILYIENNTDYEFEFDIEQVAKSVIEKTLEVHNITYDISLSLYIEDNNTIHEINNSTRGIDRPTDVLSFPNIEFENEADFSIIEEDTNNFDYFDPDDHTLILGEIIISYEKVIEQAGEYGHSIKREFAFLVAHSILHLIGYDHMEDDERLRMENMQRLVLDSLKIYRD